jgi:hypothetical protein
MKHPYRPECACARCEKEKARRTAQGQAINPYHVRQVRQAKRQTRRPAVGSQEWAESRGDDLGESGDY